MTTVKNAPPQPTGAALSADQTAVGQALQRHYQLHCVGPTPARMEMLLNELERRSAPHARLVA